MTKLQFGIFGAAALTAAVMLWLQHQAGAGLRAENLSLQQQIERLTSSSVTNGVSSNRLALTQSPAPPNDPLTELERLRAEADARKNEIQKLREQIAAVQSAPGGQALPASFRFENLPKDSWAFAGYATPEAALQSMLWATREGKVSAIQDSLTPDELSRRQNSEWKGKTDSEIADLGVQELNKATGFQILKIEMLNPDTTHFTVYVDGFDQPDQPIWMDMKKVGNEWKSDASERHRQ